MRIVKTALLLTAVSSLCVAPSAFGAAYTFFEGFEGYANGSSMHGQGGWAGWDNAAAATGYVMSSPFSQQGTNVVQIVGASDLTHNFGGSGGGGTLSIWQFIPTTFTGETYLILLNTYAPSGTDNWSVQLKANSTDGLLHWDNSFTGQTTSVASIPFIKGEWVQYQFNINFTANTVSAYYNNLLITTGKWYDTASGSTAQPLLGAIDLFGNGAGNVYYDNLSVVVPEPGSLSLLALGGLTMLALRRKASR